MKNILLLTSVYPASDLPKDNTPIVHYFSREWVANGYNVKVIHNIQYYPRYIYFVINLFKQIISKHYYFNFQTKRNSTQKNYILDNVDVYRIPIYKRLPLSLFSLQEQKKQLNKIIKLIDSINFQPDAVIAHWANPQLYQVQKLGELYNSRTCLVLHNDVEMVRKVYRNGTRDIVNSIDIWGFRSNEIKNRFEGLYGSVNKSFICYSGIPSNTNFKFAKSFEKGIKNFIFTGALIPRKFPLAIVKALNKAYEEKDFQISFIGNGPEKENIKKLAENFKITNNVSLLGRIPREDVFRVMHDSDCFIMISKPETLGLVYIEAMSMGCITIGSKNEGIDGIIQHGVNGFLCNPGDHEELSDLLKSISKLNQEKLLQISKNAIITASELTDKKVAKRYLDAVFN